MPPLPMSGTYIGLMSGTSTDGVDGVLADLAGDAIRVQASASLSLPDDLRRELLALNAPGPDELARAAQAANALADCYAAVVADLLAQAGLRAPHIRAIGAHGQTVRHAPESGYTLQINAPARLAEHTGIAVVADFRSRDVAAGGQGAPLVPAFHAARFGCGAGRAVLNLGGIANLTVLTDPVRGFDTGPANMLMDAWIRRHRGLAYDQDGAWAAQGRCHDGLLAALRAESWFALAPPKSTGRDLFSLDWLDARATRTDAAPEPSGLVDLARPAFRFGLAGIRVHSDADRLQVQVEADHDTYQVRQHAKVRIQAPAPGAVEPAR